MKKTKIYVLVFALIVGFCASAFTACFTPSSLKASVTQINIAVGDSINLDQYISASSGECVYITKSNKESVIAVLNINTIKAVKEGEATITAVSAINSNDTVSIKVKAEYKAPFSLKLNSSSDLFLKTNEIEPVTFVAQLNEGANPNTRFNWYVNDVRQVSTLSSFTFEPEDRADEYRIKVVCQSNTSLTETKILRVYEEFEQPFLINYFGKNIIENGETFFAHIFFENQPSNPALVFDWYINGALYSNYPTLEFSSLNAGKYVIKARVNNQPVYTPEGDDKIEVFVRGRVKPSPISIDFKTEYPKINVVWKEDRQTKYQITISKAGSNPIVIGNIDATLNKFDISDYVSVTETFTVTLNSLDFGEIYLADYEYSSAIHTALSQRAKLFLEKAYVGGNFYAMSDEDIYSIFEYAVTFRPYEINLSVDKSQSSVTFHMGYTSSLSLMKMSATFVDRLNMTGSYQWQLGGSLKKDKEATITINFLAKNQPTDFNYNLSQLQHQLLIPYGISETGLKKKEFKADSFPLSPQKISTSDQLFFALEKGYRPDLVNESTAQRIYNDARNSLALIIDNDMNDEQKALAIYDYLMSRVSYDYDVLEIKDISQSVLKTAYYMEGVFDVGFAVCDGISKAYSLLTNIVGIKCRRVVGSVASGGDWGEHAWNKILIGGEWYIVDATWGLSRQQLGYKYYKRSTRQFFMLLDSDFILNRLEKGGEYPKTSLNDYDFFDREQAFIHDASNITSVLLNIANSMKENKTKTYKIGDNEYNCDYYAREFQFALSISRSEMEARTRNALNNAGIEDYYVFTSDDILTIAIT